MGFGAAGLIHMHRLHELQPYIVRNLDLNGKMKNIMALSLVYAALI